jgi:creatinine amidohydrolase
MLENQKPVLWDELSWEEIAAIRDSGMDMVILPVGATEQHGLHLPTGVDTISAVAIASGVSAKTGIPMLPPIAYGCSLGHSKKWPGTLPLRPQTLATIISELAEWVSSAGYKRFLILNGHVTNFAPLRCALENIRNDIPDMKIALRSIWELTEDVEAFYTADAGDNWHANNAETSLMMHLRPDLVNMAKAQDEPNRSADRFFSYTVDKESHCGGVGEGSKGTKEQGQFVLESCVLSLASLLEKALVEEAPLS